MLSFFVNLESFVFFGFENVSFVKSKYSKKDDIKTKNTYEKTDVLGA